MNDDGRCLICVDAEKGQGRNEKFCWRGFLWVRPVSDGV